MSVSTSRSVGDVALYTPFRGFDRAAGGVGTLHVDTETTGDGSGGTVTLTLTMKRLEFGFHPIWVPTRVAALDNLATPEVVTFQMKNGGNERLKGDVLEVELSVAAALGNNVATFGALGVAVEPTVEAGAAVFSMLWSTNTNLKIYHLHVYGILYDGEAMARAKARGKAPDELLGGIR